LRDNNTIVGTQKNTYLCVSHISFRRGKSSKLRGRTAVFCACKSTFQYTNRSALHFRHAYLRYCGSL